MSEEKPLTSNIESEQADSEQPETMVGGNNEGYADDEKINNASPPVKQRSGFFAAVAWFAMLLALGGVLASYYLWNHLRKVEHDQQQAINSLRDNSTQLMEQLHQRADRASQNIDLLPALDSRLSQV